MALRSLQRTVARSYSSMKPGLVARLLNDAPSQNALNEEFPGVPATTAVKAALRDTQVTTLSNGLRVVTRDASGPAAAIGVFVKAGSRYEAVPGTAAVLEQLAFLTTQKRSTAKLQRDVETAGARVAARTGREVFTYTADVLRDNVDAAVGVLAEVITQPKLWSWEVTEGIHAYEPLAEDGARNPKTALIEGLHAAAFGGTSALGHSLFARPSDLEDIDATVLRSFLGARFTAANTVVVANNVKHDVFVNTCDKYLLSLPEGVPTTSVTTGAPGVHGPERPAFVGGEHHIRTHEGGVAHVAVGLAAPAYNSKEFAALSVLQALLGAGGSRTAPVGQSRIARSLHNDAHSFIASLTSFALPYSDAGMVGIAGSCADHEAGRLVNVIAGFFDDAAKVAATAAELERAKKGLKLAIASDVETRDGARAELGTSVLLAGKPSTLADAFKAIDDVKAGDVQAVAKAAFASKPALASIGSLTTVPRYDVFASMFKA